LIALDDPSILNLSFVTESFGLKIMYPYYILLGTAGLYHTCYGIIQSLHVLKISRFQLKPGSWIFWSKVFTGVMISTILALAGFYEYIPSDMHDVNVQVSRVPFALVGLDYSLH
jgi:membrane protein CcdC involved in cytochrome C biogenesis